MTRPRCCAGALPDRRHTHADAITTRTTPSTARVAQRLQFRHRTHTPRSHRCHRHTTAHTLALSSLACTPPHTRTAIERIRALMNPPEVASAHIPRQSRRQSRQSRRWVTHHRSMIVLARLTSPHLGPPSDTALGTRSNTFTGGLQGASLRPPEPLAHSLHDHDRCKDILDCRGVGPRARGPRLYRIRAAWSASTRTRSARAAAAAMGAAAGAPQASSRHLAA